MRPLRPAVHLLVLERVPALLAVPYPQQRDHHPAQKLHLVVPVLIEYGDFQHRRHVLNITVGGVVLGILEN